MRLVFMIAAAWYIVLAFLKSKPSDEYLLLCGAASVIIVGIVCIIDEIRKNK